MSSFVPNRSAKGCLTCKQRRKKCDESKPICKRCTTGGFQCLGYSHLETSGFSSTQAPRRGRVATMQRASLRMFSAPNARSQSVHHDSKPAVVALIPSNSSFDPNKSHKRRDEIVQSFYVSPSFPVDIVGFIVSQYMPFLRRSFRPFHSPVQEGLVKTARKSSLTCWSMYIGARIIHDVSRRIKPDGCSELVRQVHHLAIANPANDSPETRLRCCQNLFSCNLLQSRTGPGYSLLKQSTEIFVELVDQHPHLKSPHSRISLYSALCSTPPEVSRFASFDTILSVVFAVPPLVHYDTIHQPTNLPPANSRAVNLMYGWTTEILWLLGKINAWRASRWTDQVDTYLFDWKEIQTEIEHWRPSVEHNDDASAVVGRFTVYEAWRQAALVYLYMGMCMVNSADPRVEAAVRQIAQLASTIEPGAPLELHISIPCLIAGAAARFEKHRTVLRSKLLSTRENDLWFIPGSDLVRILDHLWHGAGVGGYPTLWEDYVDARCAALPFGDASRDLKS